MSKFKTFIKRPFKEDFSAETDGEGYIALLLCKVWCDSLKGTKVD